MACVSLGKETCSICLREKFDEEIEGFGSENAEILKVSERT